MGQPSSITAIFENLAPLITNILITSLIHYLLYKKLISTNSLERGPLTLLLLLPEEQILIQIEAESQSPFLQ